MHKIRLSVDAMYQPPDGIGLVFNLGCIIFGAFFRQREGVEYFQLLKEATILELPYEQIDSIISLKALNVKKGLYSFFTKWKNVIYRISANSFHP